AVCVLNAPLTYYGQVTNLDGPYLFWGSTALWNWMRLAVERDLRAIRWAMLAMAAAIATKDQAYALFALSLPILLLSWFAVDPWASRNKRRLLP
ncbi:hypothetical protein ABTM78_20500, partial [Acinetobacter baumannii]